MLDEDQHAGSDAGAPAGSDREPLEILRDRVLATSWQYLDVIERLGAGPTGRLLAERIEAERAQAGVKLPPLERWPSLPERSYGTYVGGTNPVRMARLLDFVQAGDRVLDIGIGYGYVTSVLARTGLLEHYCGIDLTDRYITTAREGLEFNRLPSENVHLEVGDLYELSAEWVERHRPNLVFLLEVLEHVPDTQAGLKTLADALAPGTSVLFTVPTIGRLEGVWGHRSLFDQQRIRQLCEGAGLTIQYVEPLHNVWTLVMASTTPEIPSRLLAAAAAPTPIPAPAPEHDYVFRDVELKRPSDVFRRTGRPKRGRALVKRTREGVRCEVSPTPGQDAPYYGGIAIEVDAPGIVRLQVEYESLGNVEAVFVDGYEGDTRVGRWKWVVADAPTSDDVVVHVLKPRGGGRFKPVGRIDAARIERLELYVELKGGAGETAFVLRRAAYVGGWTDAA